jgi:mitochondrial ornithine carrier protein
MPSKLKRTSTRSTATAGYVAGIAGVIMGHPLDSAKVWLQTNAGSQNKHFKSSTYSVGNRSIGNTNAGFIRSTAGASSLSFSSTATSATPMLEQAPIRASPILSSSSSLKYYSRTLRALYSGVGAPLVTVGLVQSASFTAYDGLRRSLYQRDHPDAGMAECSMDHLHNDSLTNVALAGFWSGSALSFFTAPLVQVKTRQQITGNGFRQTLFESLRRPEGANPALLPRCFAGFGPHFLMESVGRAVYYTTYEACKRGIANYQGVSNTASISLQDRMLSAGFAGIVCGAIIFPLDSLRSRIYSQAATTANPKTTWQMLQFMYYENGVRGFYRGFGVTVLRSGPVSSVVLPIYDLVLASMVTEA